MLLISVQKKKGKKSNDPGHESMGHVTVTASKTSLRPKIKAILFRSEMKRTL